MRVYSSQPIAATVLIDNGKTSSLKAISSELTYKVGGKHDPFFVTGSVLLPDSKGNFDSERSALTITINADLTVSVVKDNSQILGLSKVTAKIAGMICVKQHELARALLIVGADMYTPKNGPLTVEPVSVLFNEILSHGGDDYEVEKLTALEVATIFASIAALVDQYPTLEKTPLVNFALDAAKALQTKQETKQETK